MPNHAYTPVIRIVKPNEFDTGTAQTAGSVDGRDRAADGDRDDAVGRSFDVEPGAHDCSLKSAHEGSPCRGAPMTCRTKPGDDPGDFLGVSRAVVGTVPGTIPPRKRGLP